MMLFQVVRLCVHRRRREVFDHNPAVAQCCPVWLPVVPIPLLLDIFGKHRLEAELVFPARFQRVLDPVRFGLQHIWDHLRHGAPFSTLEISPAFQLAPS